MAAKQGKLATPLVLPNNCIWNEKTGECITHPYIERETLTVIPKALDQLRAIKGHVCVVSIAGRYRHGKSYILSKAFEQGEVFPLGHYLDPETMGIWLWVVPKKFKDSTGREFTVVLMDSEGIDAVSSKQSDDHSIFTLSVLLSSIMIYNSAGVPNRSDLEGLDFIPKLSQRIQLQSNQQTTNEQQFYETFPYFIWLLRDVVLILPKGCETMKDFFIKYVLNCEAEGNTEKARKTAESILKYFSGFDAFSLPPPAYDSEVIRNLGDEHFQSQINPKFLKEIEDFKTMLHSKLSPKTSINKGEFVTGEALAALTELFVEALNTPGTVPNVQDAWDTFVHTKCSEVLSAAVKAYEQEMTSLVEKKLPCEAHVLRSVHEEIMGVCLEMFRNETFSLSIKSVDKYWKEFMEKTNSSVSAWLEKNKAVCTKLFKDLKKEPRKNREVALTRQSTGGIRSLKGAKSDYVLMHTLNSHLENIACVNQVPEQQLAEYNNLVFSNCAESWSDLIRLNIIDKYSLLNGIAKVHSLVTSMLENKDNTPDNIVDLTFLAHGTVTMPPLPCRFHFLDDVHVDSIVLYAPWGCRLDATAAYGIATGTITQDNIAFDGFLNVAQRLKHWNNLPKDGTRIPDVVFTRVSLDDGVMQRFTQIDAKLQRQARGIFLPFLPEQSSIDIIPLWLLCVAVAIRGIQLNKKYRIHIASCLYPMKHDILAHSTDPDNVFPTVKCEQYWAVPISDRPVTMTMEIPDLHQQPDLQNLLHDLNNNYLNKP